MQEFSSPSLRLTLSGMNKLNTNIPTAKLPFEPSHLPSHLYQIYEALDMKNVEDFVLWAIIPIGFYAMLRRSQFANSSRASFNPKEQLTRGDIQITEEGLVINVQSSKTNQKHNSVRQIPLFKTC